MLRKNAIIGFHMSLYPFYLMILLCVGNRRYSCNFSRHYYLSLLLPWHSWGTGTKLVAKNKQAENVVWGPKSNAGKLWKSWGHSSGFSVGALAARPVLWSCNTAGGPEKFAWIIVPLLPARPAPNFLPTPAVKVHTPIQQPSCWTARGGHKVVALALAT